MEIEQENAETYRQPHVESATQRSAMEELEAEEEDDTVFNPPTRTFSFRLGRKRRKSNSSNSSQEYDDVSLCSLSSLDSVGSLEKQPKKRRSLARVTSLASMLSPSKPMKMFGRSLQKSLSLRSLNQEVFPPNGHAPHAKPDSSFVSPYKKPGPTPTKRRASRLWMDTVNGASLNLSVKEVKRQEAMFELYQGEEDMLEDLRLAKKTYRDSMQQLKLMTEEELQCVFGRLDRLLPLHEDSVKRLKQVRDSETYTIDSIGDALLAWLPSMRSPYVEYCANQVYAKSLLDAKKVDRRVQDFLQRCLESPFSRKLDLWSFLDVPRSRLVKYPILLKAILKYTPPNHRDIELLHTAVKLIESIIGEVDREAGQQKCQFVINRLVESEHRIHPLIHESHYLLCAGELRNSRGTKVDVFLFEKVLVVTRKITRNSTALYQIYRSPLPVADMTVDEKEHGGLQRSSFRRSLSSLTSQGQAQRSLFHIGCVSDPTQSQTFEANDEHNKKQWLQCLNSVISHDDAAAASAPCKQTQQLIALITDEQEKTTEETQPIADQREKTTTETQPIADQREKTTTETQPITDQREKTTTTTARQNRRKSAEAAAVTETKTNKNAEKKKSSLPGKEAKEEAEEALAAAEGEQEARRSDVRLRRQVKARRGRRLSRGRVLRDTNSADDILRVSHVRVTRRSAANLRTITSEPLC